MDAKGLFENVSEDVKARALACNSAEELAKLAREEGIELTDDQLEAISGGKEWYEGCSTQTGC